MDGRNEQSRYKILFRSRSICGRNTSIGTYKKLMGMRLWNYQIFLVGIVDFEMEGSW
jgi:hypothetical protein